MSYAYLQLAKESGIGKIVLNRPKVMNALNREMLLELKKALKQAGRDKEIAVVVITGAGRAFSAGVDLGFLGAQNPSNGRVGGVLDRPARGVIEAIQEMPKAVIAAVNGHCYAGALEIALACDLIVASEDALFGDTHVRWGLRPSWGMSARLPLAVGYMKAKELSFTAKVITAREAEAIGLVNVVVAADKMEAAVKEWARNIMSNSLDAVAAYKRLYNDALAKAGKEGLRAESNSKLSIRDTGSRIATFRGRKQ